MRGPALTSHPSPQSVVNRRQKLCRALGVRGHDLCLPQGYALRLAIGITIDFAPIVGMMFHRAVLAPVTPWTRWSRCCGHLAGKDRWPSRPRQSHSREDKDLVLRVGSSEIDWPKAIGDFGGIWLVVAYDDIAPPLGLFIAAIPGLKLLKHPDQPRSVRIVSDVLEGAAKPVGSDSETTVRLAQAGRSRRAATPLEAGCEAQEGCVRPGIGQAGA